MGYFFSMLKKPLSHVIFMMPIFIALQACIISDVKNPSAFDSSAPQQDAGSLSAAPDTLADIPGLGFDDVTQDDRSFLRNRIAALVDPFTATSHIEWDNPNTGSQGVISDLN